MSVSLADESGEELREIEDELQSLFNRVELVQSEMCHLFPDGASVHSADHLAENLRWRALDAYFRVEAG
jgi:hypothetical protein